MPARSLPICLTALLAVAALLLGCGSEGSADRPATAQGQDPEPAIPKVPKAEFIEEGDTICRGLNRKIRLSARAYFENPRGSPPAGLAAKIVARQLVPKMGLEITRLRAHALRAEDAEGALPVIRAMQVALNGIKRDPVAFYEASRRFAESQRLGRKFGFEVCGRL